jgi:hypothetical protein
MIGKARTNVRAEIDTQHEILLQMIEDIADHYQEKANDFEENVYKIANDNSDGDSDIKYSILRSLDESLEKQISLSSEARKIMFCAIFSYCESMLYEIISYFRIPRKRANQIEQLIDKITKEYETRYIEVLSLPNERTICDFYRRLRNWYMHGQIDSVKDREFLRFFSEQDKRISIYPECAITDNDFLRESLNIINAFLVFIEEVYCKKEKECNWKNTINS